MTLCKWCGDEFEPPPSAPHKLYCTPAHRAKHKRAVKAAELADIVERLGPHVNDSGLDTYAELVENVRFRLNAVG